MSKLVGLIAVDNSLFMGMLHRVANQDEQFKPCLER